MARLHTIEELRARAAALAEETRNFRDEVADSEAPLPPLLAVKQAAWQRDAARLELSIAVRAARKQGLSWLKIGTAIEGIG